MAYVTNDNLTKTYIDSLVAKCSFTDVTAENPGYLLVVKDLNENINYFYDYPSARDFLITQYVIQQNS